MLGKWRSFIGAYGLHQTTNWPYWWLEFSGSWKIPILSVDNTLVVLLQEPGLAFLDKRSQNPEHLRGASGLIKLAQSLMHNLPDYYRASKHHCPWADQIYIIKTPEYTISLAEHVGVITAGLRITKYSIPWHHWLLTAAASETGSPLCAPT